MSEHHHHSHVHHHDGHHRHLRRKKRQRMRAACIAVAAVVLLAAGGICYQSWKKQNSYHVTAGNSIDMKDGYRSRTWQGKEYQYNSLITTILVAGLDSEGEMEAVPTYGNKARADSIALVILDKQHQKIKILTLNRDTMTEIHRYTREGMDYGLYTSHLGYAYSYGDGGDASCENLEEAVQRLLGGIPISDYVVINRSSFAQINDLVGGVTLTVPNDDLTGQYPDLVKGAQVTLNDSNVEAFLRYRDTGIDFSNEGRMERQQAFVTAYIGQFQELLQTDLERAWNATQDMDGYLQTSITRNKYLGLANLVKNLSFTDADYYRPAGEDQLGELHDEFYLDEDAFEEMILDLFYEPASE